ncbi:CHRD domain-containing protein [Massilia endophytica]|uniref:CHRD domain-containing protein n=1 Tax=Massilia endophytica TaxID=2899220 RepID=UPI001E380013|nr:CHRD domain-containing protein [Massilia endophytica]UGQ44675.1 CHRD domain-containing protein [Massilia endophytica]
MKSLFLKCLAALALALGSAAAMAESYTTSMTGLQEVTPNDSPAVGAGIVTFDVTSHTITIGAVFTGLEAGVTAAHIHCCTADAGVGGAPVATMVPTFAGFPAGVTEGTYLMSFDTSMASFWNPAFITAHGGTTSGAEMALLDGMNAGMAYLNIHTSEYPGGEIRGFLMLTPVPEPGMGWMLLMGVPLAVGLARRRRE